MSTLLSFPGNSGSDVVNYFLHLGWKMNHSFIQNGNKRLHVVTLERADTKVRVLVNKVTLEFKTKNVPLEHAIKSILNSKHLYKSLTGTEKFLGEEHDTLTKQAFDRGVLTRFNYSVTNSTTDERFLFYINKYGVPSFVSRKLEYSVVPGMQPKTDYADTILDGEFVQGTFYARDILFAKGKDIREKTLPQRLDILFNTLMGLQLQLLRMNIYFIVLDDNKVYEYPGKKQTKFANIYEASSSKTNTNLLFVPVDPTKSTFVWKQSEKFKPYNSPSVLFIDSKNFSVSSSKKFEEVKLKTDLKNFFESRETLEKLLVSLYKHVSPGGTFKGFIRSSKTSGKLLDSNFEKFKQVMKKWDFNFTEKTSKGDFVFVRNV
jgi:hypothetical protein